MFLPNRFLISTRDIKALTYIGSITSKTRIESVRIIDLAGGSK